MAWLEDPQKVLSIATVALVIGFSIVALGVTLLSVLAG